MTSSLTLAELKVILVKYEEQVNEAIQKKVSTIEDLQFQRGKAHAIKVLFTLVTDEKVLNHFRDNNFIKEGGVLNA